MMRTTVFEAASDQVHGRIGIPALGLSHRLLGDAQA